MVLKLTLQGTALFPIEKIVSGIASIIILLFEFFDLAKYDFTENAAKVLYAIYLIDKRKFTLEEVLSIYNQNLIGEFNSNDMKEILDHLSYLKCIKINNETNIIILNEKIQIKRA